MRRVGGKRRRESECESPHTPSSCESTKTSIWQNSLEVNLPRSFHCIFYPSWVRVLEGILALGFGIGTGTQTFMLMLQVGPGPEKKDARRNSDLGYHASRCSCSWNLKFKYVQIQPLQMKAFFLCIALNLNLLILIKPLFPPIYNISYCYIFLTLTLTSWWHEVRSTFCFLLLYAKVGLRQRVHGCYSCSQRVRFSECAFCSGSPHGTDCTMSRRSAPSA
jgi:hypothetical protein